jgi:hypothetical protein
MEHQEWSQAINRIQSHPEECGLYGEHSALSCACHNQAPIELIDELLKAEPSATQQVVLNGSLPLHLALSSSSSNEVIQRLLIANPFAASVPDVNGQLPLHWAIQEQAEDEIVRMIVVAYPAGCHHRNSYGKIPAHMSSTTPETLRILEQAPLWQALASSPLSAVTRPKSDGELRQNDDSRSAAADIQRLHQELSLERRARATLEEELVSLRLELGHTKNRLQQQQGIMTQIQEMITDGQRTPTTPAVATHTSPGVLVSTSAAVPTATVSSSSLKKSSHQKQPTTTLKETTSPLSDLGQSRQSQAILCSDSQSSCTTRRSREDHDEERNPPPVPSYRKDDSSPRRSKSAPRPSRAAVQEWLSSGSRDLAELERPSSSPYQRRANQTTVQPSSAPTGSKMMYSHSLLERTKNSMPLRQGLASRAAERVKQTRQQQQQHHQTKEVPRIPVSKMNVATTEPSRSSFIALQTTGLVATPPASTVRPSFDFNECDSDDDSGRDEDPTIFSRAEWYY